MSASLEKMLPKLIKQAVHNDPRDPTTAVEFDTETACDFFRKYSPNLVDYVLQPAMDGDYLINTSVGQAHWSGLQAAQQLSAFPGS